MTVKQLIELLQEVKDQTAQVTHQIGEDEESLEVVHIRIEVLDEEEAPVTTVNLL